MHIVERPETDLLLLAVRLNQTLLAETIPAYNGPHPGSVLVPMGELCRILGLAIDVDVTHGTAEGFFIAENRRFFLDAVAGKVLVEGRPKRFDPSGIEVHRDDVYVDSTLLGSWLPVDFGVNLYESLIQVRPREPLPVQRRMEREAEAKRGLASLGLSGPKYPKMDVPYRALDWPMVDQTLRFTLTPKTGGGSSVGFQAATLLAGDFLWHQANAYLFFDDDGLADQRFSLGRQDPERGLLGPLRASAYAGGDVLYPGLEAIALPRSSTGLLLTNFPLDRQTRFDRHTFRGELPLGWDVELYQNGALIAFQSSRPDGLYEFNDVPLLFGLNVFRLAFFGPQGQRRQEVHRFNIGDSLTPPGQLHYQIVGNDFGGSFERAHVELDYGVSKRLSLLGSIADLTLTDGRRRYGRVGMRGFWDVVYAELDAVAATGGGTLIQAALQGRLGPIGVSASHAQLSGFTSEIFRPLYGNVRSRSSLRLDATMAGAFSLTLSAEGRRDRIETGLDVIQMTGRLSAGYRGIAASNFIDWTTFRGGPSPPEPVALGAFLVSKFVRQFNLRAEVLYQLEPTAALSDVILTGETRVLKDYLVSAGVNRVLPGGPTRFLASVSRYKGLFSFGVNLDYASPGGLTAALTINAGLAREPFSGRLRMQARPMAGAGALAARTFLDANGNGIWDPGEKAAENVGFVASRGAQMEATGANGVAFLSGLPAGEDSDVGVSLRTLEDPLERPSREGVRFVPRAGRIVAVDFPIVFTGEVTGTVYLARDDRNEERSGVELELVEAGGTVVARARSAYDGFYDITRIPPGRYRLRVSPAQVERLKLLAPEPREIVIEPVGTILDAVNIILERAP
ncbi:MAG: carboxypeptidase-like regulatory domain-containing protein [Thermoanaerobaculia bacterium]|nr:carboxypeptidase-like regulatory domain-containing protein [Thermoanaerobaculia bacterium]